MDQKLGSIKKKKPILFCSKKVKDGMVIISAADFEVAPIKKLEVFHKQKFVSCGIGSLAAAKNAYKLISQIRGEDVVIVGTCGFFGDFVGVELVTGEDVYWLPSGQRLGYAWSIEKEIPHIKLSCTSYFEQLPKRTILSSPTISKYKGMTGTLKGIFCDEGSMVENLELYPLVSQINPYAKSISIILGVTNEICLLARDQWKRHYKEAAIKTADYLQRCLPII